MVGLSNEWGWDRKGFEIRTWRQCEGKEEDEDEGGERDINGSLREGRHSGTLFFATEDRRIVDREKVKVVAESGRRKGCVRVEREEPSISIR